MHSHPVGGLILNFCLQVENWIRTQWKAAINLRNVSKIQIRRLENALQVLIIIEFSWHPHIHSRFAENRNLNCLIMQNHCALTNIYTFSNYGVLPMLIYEKLFFFKAWILAECMARLCSICKIKHLNVVLFSTYCHDSL